MSVEIARFYALIDELSARCGGGRKLKDCSGEMEWPRRGVYFFFEPGEIRAAPNTGPRVVRIGTHAVSVRSRTTLWNRLSNHRGPKSGFGNHRGSVFRLHVGAALLSRYPEQFSAPFWGKKSNAWRGVKDSERELEGAVSDHIGAMTVLWLAVDDDSGKNSKRSVIERNSIGLLSSWRERHAGDDWLGSFSPTKEIRESRLWNVNYVGLHSEPSFLEMLERLVYSTPNQQS